MLRDGPLGEGSACSGSWSATCAQHYFTIHEAHPELHDVLRAIAVLDVIANNTDRKSGHCLLTPPGDDAPGHVWAIDNGLTFSADFKLRTVIWEFGGEVVADRLLDAVRRVHERVPLDVAALLADDEVDGDPTTCRGAAHAGPLPDRPERPPLPLAAGVTARAMDDDARAHDDVLDELVHRGDLDGLVRMVDDRTLHRGLGRPAASA